MSRPTCGTSTRPSEERTVYCFEHFPFCIFMFLHIHPLYKVRSSLTVEGIPCCKFCWQGYYKETQQRWQMIFLCTCT